MQLRKIFSAIIIFSLFLTACGGRNEAPTELDENAFIVDTLEDSQDKDPKDGECKDTEGRCSLRAAIAQANVDSTPNTIILPSPNALEAYAENFEQDDPADPKYLINVNIAPINLEELDEVTTSTYILDIAGAEENELPKANNQQENQENNEEVVPRTGNQTNGESVEEEDPFKANRNRPANFGDLDILHNITIKVEATGWFAPFKENTDRDESGYISDLNNQYWVYIDAQRIGNRIFHIHKNASVTIEGLRLINANSAQNGGAILFQGSQLFLKNVGIYGNHANGSGGGIYVEKPESFLILEKVSIGENTAQQNGGGIYNQGVIQITEGNFVNNRSFQGSGGGIYNLGAQLEITNGYFLRNTAGSSDQATCDSQGGAIYNLDGKLLISLSLFRHNSARRSGGAIFTNYEDPHPTFEPFISNSWIDQNLLNTTNCTGEFTGAGLHNGKTRISLSNTTISSNDFRPPANSVGGGLYNAPDGLVSISNLTVSANQAAAGAGLANDGFMSIFSSTIVNNRAEQDGGGIHVLEQQFTVIQNSILSLNTAGRSGIDCYGQLNSRGYNLIGLVGEGCSIVEQQPGTDQYSQSPADQLNPALGPLRNNGGPEELSPPTHLPLQSSPAWNSGDPRGCEDDEHYSIGYDQRGLLRHQGTACDIGAVETVEICLHLENTQNVMGQLYDLQYGEQIASFTPSAFFRQYDQVNQPANPEMNIVEYGGNNIQLSGNMLMLARNNVEIDFGSPILGLSLDFHLSNPPFNLKINNGKIIITDNPETIPSSGGIDINIFIPASPNNTQSYSRLNAFAQSGQTIETFIIGGQHIYMDNICALPSH